MLLNADMSRRVVIDTEEAPWMDSPLPGVQRRMLERDGDEVARATSIVRYAPGSRFAEHTHGLGEEFLVLEGVFSDEHGNYPAGSYVRNPPGSRHRPRSGGGCTLFVKLRQMDPDDRCSVRIDTAGASWSQGTEEGLLVMPLHSTERESVSLVKLEPGTRLGRHDHPKWRGDLGARRRPRGRPRRLPQRDLAAKPSGQRARAAKPRRLRLLHQDRTPHRELIPRPRPSERVSASAARLSAEARPGLG